MTRREIWIELVRQHAELRDLIESARLVASRARNGEPLRAELKASALAVTDALGAHNMREEELLLGKGTAVDVVGPAGREIMNEQHFEEHQALHGALLDVHTDPDDYWVAKNMMEVLDRILAHMAHEEKIFALSDTSQDEDTKPA